MLNNQVQQYIWWKLTTTKNEYGEDVKSYINNGKINAAISFNSKVAYYNNDSNLTNCNYIATNIDVDISTISKGDIIGRAEVVFIQGKFIFLKEIGNNGKVDIITGGK